MLFCMTSGCGHVKDRTHHRWNTGLEGTQITPDPYINKYECMDTVLPDVC